MNFSASKRRHALTIDGNPRGINSFAKELKRKARSRFHGGVKANTCYRVRSDFTSGWQSFTPFLRGKFRRETESRATSARKRVHRLSPGHVSKRTSIKIQMSNRRSSFVANRELRTTETRSYSELMSSYPLLSLYRRRFSLRYLRSRPCAISISYFPLDSSICRENPSGIFLEWQLQWEAE